MKAIKVMMMSVMALATVVVARAEEKTVPYSQLPNTAQQFIRTHYGQDQMNDLKIERDMSDNSYKVVTRDGTQLKFNDQGEWRKVESKASALPVGIVPGEIQNYITTNHRGMHLIKIDREADGYDVKLNNGKDIKFDKAHKVIKYD